MLPLLSYGLALSMCFCLVFSQPRLNLRDDVLTRLSEPAPGQLGRFDPQDKRQMIHDGFSALSSANEALSILNRLFPRSRGSDGTLWYGLSPPQPRDMPIFLALESYFSVSFVVTRASADYPSIIIIREKDLAAARTVRNWIQAALFILRSPQRTGFLTAELPAATLMEIVASGPRTIHFPFWGEVAWDTEASFPPSIGQHAKGFTFGPLRLGQDTATKTAGIFINTRLTHWQRVPVRERVRSSTFDFAADLLAGLDFVFVHELMHAASLINHGEVFPAKRMHIVDWQADWRKLHGQGALRQEIALENANSYTYFIYTLLLNEEGRYDWSTGAQRVPFLPDQTHMAPADLGFFLPTEPHGMSNS